MSMDKRTSADGFIGDFVGMFENNTLPKNSIYEKLYEKLILFKGNQITNIKNTAYSYSEVGDIEVDYKDGEKIFFEIKYLSNNQKGTLANLSTNVLKDYNIFEDEFYSFADFNEKINWHFGYVSSKLKEYNIHFVPVTRTHIYEEARKLRDDANLGIDKAIFIKQKIEEEAKNKKIEYLNYLSNQRILNNKNLILLINDLYEGRHSKKQKLSENKVVYIYINNVSNTIEIKEETIDFYGNCYIEYILGETSFKIKNEKKETLLTFSLHWGNVFQGIQTLCFRVFSKG